MKNHPIRSSRLPFPWAKRQVLLSEWKNWHPKYTAPYNPTLLSSPSGFDCFSATSQFRSALGPLCDPDRNGSLNDRFEQTAEYKRIQVGSENMRKILGFCGLKRDLSAFNAMEITSTGWCIWQISIQPALEVNYTTLLDYDSGHWKIGVHSTHRRWAVHFYIESIQSRRFLTSRSSCKQNSQIYAASGRCYLSLSWEKKLGKIRGGTPPQKSGWIPWFFPQLRSG